MGETTKKSTNHSQSLIENWQSKFPSLREKLTYTLANSQFTDVSFSVGPFKELVECNKFILCVNSSVFDAMFSSRWTTNDAQIELPDVDPISFKIFLKYLYTEELKVRVQDALPLIYLAKKYDVPALCEKCVKLLERNVNTLNSVTIYQKAQIFEEQALEDLAKDFICKNAIRVFAGHDYLTLTRQNLCYFLGLDELKIDESSLFRAVYRWTIEQCQNLELTPENYRSILGDEAISLIRFPLLSAEEFTFEIVDKGLLVDADIITLLKYFSISAEKRVDLPQFKFNAKPRTPLFPSAKYLVSRFSSIKSDAFTCDNRIMKRHCFDVNRPISLISIGLFGPSKTFSNVTYTVDLELLDAEMKFVPGSKISGREVQVKPKEEIFHVEFETFVKINASEQYTISLLNLKGPNTRMGDGNKSEVSIRVGSGSTLSDEIVFRFQDSKDNNTSCQLPEICFTLL